MARMNTPIIAVKVDFDRTIGRVKPLHGVNNGPKTGGFHLDMSRYFLEAGIPYSRLHDTEYPYGSGHFVDIPCVFPHFEADPDDPASYDFALTDEYINAIRAVGAKSIYRLGVSIEHSSRKYHVFPPKDYDQWARICAGIVRHYNEGWAGGFHHGIDYWEIWNEPENPPMWQGSREDYFRLYVTTSRHLKSRFPKLKVGGYGSCGFYALTRENQGNFSKGFISYFTEFLRTIASPDTRAPLDFFSWHLYTDRIEEMTAHATYVQTTLRQHGFEGTESILDEWNYWPGDGADPFARMRQMEAASFVAGVFCALQRSPVALATYYDAQPAMGWCGIFSTTRPYKPFYAFKAFNNLYALGHEAASESDGEHLHVCAASSGPDGAVLLSNNQVDSREVAVEISGVGRDVELEFHELNESSDLDLKRSENLRGPTCRSELVLAPHSVVLVKAHRRQPQPRHSSIDSRSRPTQP